MHAVTETVRRVIEPVLAQPGAGICVALSGGLDSSVLLHALSRCGVGRIRAAYIDHQLHPDAAAWGHHCERLCADLGVPFTTQRVTVAVGAGEGPEAAARRVRYQALARLLAPGEVLATAHHLDDQAETVLLNLMRGSGVAGLAGIPRQALIADSDGESAVLRPLLELSRAVLLDYARREGLGWIEDPANADMRMDRNYLRQRVVPALAERWPGLRATVGRSARLCAEAAGLLDELAAQDARRALRAGRLSIPALKALSDPRRRNLVRYRCRLELGSVPSDRHLTAGLAQLLNAGDDRSPALRWPGGEIRRYRSALYLLPPCGPVPGDGTGLVLLAHVGSALELGGGQGRLRLVRTRGRGLAGTKVAAGFTVRYRAGGERIRLPGAAHSSELKKLLQERGVVPWMRERIPLLCCGERLAAVAGLWVAGEFAAGPGEPGLSVRWEEHPPIA